MKKTFLRLHVHSVHSMRDAMLPIKTIIDEAIRNNEAPSLTDHGSMGGAISFIEMCNEKNIIGAVGCEFYLNKHIKRLLAIKEEIEHVKDPAIKKQLQMEREEKKKNNHIVILAKNTFGFYNLIKLNNKAYIEGFYGKPTIDYDDLFSMDKDENGDYGVIITSACLGGPLSQYLLNKDINAAIDWCKMMKKSFGKDFYLEVQTNHIAEQKKINKKIVLIADKLKIQLCVGIDAHYLAQDWASTHQDLLLLQNKNTRADLGKKDIRITWENPKGEVKIKKLSPEKEFRKGLLASKVKKGMKFRKGKNKFEVVIDVQESNRAWEFASDQAWYKSEADIRKDIKKQHKELAEYEDKIINGNCQIFSKLEKIELNKENKLPKVSNAYELLVADVKKNLKIKMQKGLISQENAPKYIERIKYELVVIKKNKFENYFLILADVLNYVRANNIAMGCGRGSAGGSVVAWLLGIHRLDPLDPRFTNLQFERFLNPDRISYPDIDIDVDGRARDKVIDYLIQQYGKDQVSYVGTHLEYNAKSVIRDLGTVHQIPSSESLKCTKNYGPHMSVKNNMATKTEVATYFNNHKDLIDKVDRVTGAISGLSIHAGGVIITDKKYPITKYCALQRPADDGRVATMWDKKEIEKLGFVKYDILGLNSCAQVHRAMEMLGLDPYSDPAEDVEVFKNVVIGIKNKNIFQFETFIGQKAFEDLLPMNVSELANASGIIRVLGSKQGREIYSRYKQNVIEYQQGNTEFWKEQLRNEVYSDRVYNIAVDVMQDSYGVLIFQEQLAELIHQLSGGKLSFGKGDIFRKALDYHGRDYGTIDDNQGNKPALKKWHAEFMKLLNEYVIPYIPEELKNQSVQDFIDCKFDDEGQLITPTSGVLSWIISSAAYLFNKLHAIAYSINSYNMMWLKHYHPLEFWTASLQLEESDLDKVRNYISAIRTETDIKVLPPNVNHSDLSFTMDKEKNEIRYGLKAILGLGNTAQIIVAERNENGPYVSVVDFIDRLKGTKVNKKTILNLIAVNAFADFGTQSKVHAAFIKAGKELDELSKDSTEQANKEAKLLGVNVSYTHPIMSRAALYMPLDMLEDGQQEVVAVKIMKKITKQTVNGKNYKMFKAECLNSGMVVNLFDWTNRDLTEQYLIARVSKKAGFYTLLGPSTFNPRQHFNKKLAKQILSSKGKK